LSRLIRNMPISPPAIQYSCLMWAPANFVCMVALWISITPRPQISSTKPISSQSKSRYETYLDISRQLSVAGRQLAGGLQRSPFPCLVTRHLRLVRHSFLGTRDLGLATSAARARRWPAAAWHRRRGRRRDDPPAVHRRPARRGCSRLRRSRRGPSLWPFWWAGAAASPRKP